MFLLCLFCVILCLHLGLLLFSCLVLVMYALYSCLLWLFPDFFEDLFYFRSCVSFFPVELSNFAPFIFFFLYPLLLRVFDFPYFYMSHIKDLCLLSSHINTLTLLSIPYLFHNYSSILLSILLNNLETCYTCCYCL